MIIQSLLFGKLLDEFGCSTQIVSWYTREQLYEVKERFTALIYIQSMLAKEVATYMMRDLHV
jgi:hypothetical protein